MEYKWQRVQFGWLDLKKKKEWPGGLGPALQGNFSGRFKTHAKFNRWINRRISNRFTGNNQSLLGSREPTSFMQSSEVLVRHLSDLSGSMRGSDPAEARKSTRGRTQSLREARPSFGDATKGPCNCQRLVEQAPTRV
jgi:hypothetical protein